MISPRLALVSHIRAFVDTELRGVVDYDRIEYMPADWAEPVRGRRRQHKEVVTARIGNYELTVQSSSEAPPLGSARLQYLGGVDEGPLDPVTWSRFGALIRKRSRCEG